MNPVSKSIGIVNGDGMKEYRLYFYKQSGNWKMVSITLVEIKGGKLNLREIKMDDQNMDDLKDWLDNGSGVREAISSGRSGYKRVTDDEIKSAKRNISDFYEYLEQNGYTRTVVYSVTELISKHGKERCYAVLGNGSADRVVVNIPGKDTAVCDVYGIFGKSKNFCSIYRLVHGQIKIMMDTDIDKVIEYIENA